MKTTIVLAGSYQQFLDWCRENQRSPRGRGLVCASEPHHLRGLHPKDVEIVLAGAYERNAAYLSDAYQWLLLPNDPVTRRAQVEGMGLVYCPDSFDGPRKYGSLGDCLPPSPSEPVIVEGQP